MKPGHAASELCLQPEIYILCIYVDGIVSVYSTVRHSVESMVKYSVRIVGRGYDAMQQ